MKEQAHWDGRYTDGNAPWDTGRVEKELPRVVEQYGIYPCRALEFGCGTGTNALWLAERGFRVTGIDLSQVAIERAKKAAVDIGIDAVFAVANIVIENIDNAPFGFAFDRGCFHSFDDSDEQQLCVQQLWRHLAEDALWCSLIGSADAPPRDTGPPRHSAADVTAVVEPWFEILELKASCFDSDAEEPRKAWVCVMKRRMERKQ